MPPCCSSPGIDTEAWPYTLSPTMPDVDFTRDGSEQTWRGGAVGAVTDPGHGGSAVQNFALHRIVSASDDSQSAPRELTNLPLGLPDMVRALCLPTRPTCLSAQPITAHHPRTSRITSTRHAVYYAPGNSLDGCQWISIDNPRTCSVRYIRHFEDPG